MSESSNIPGGGEEPFDVEEFARRTAWSIETGDDISSVLEDRVIRIEECVAARWPRRWLLWARLRREIRASVAGYDDSFIPRRDFAGRRLQAASEVASAERAGRVRRWEEHRRQADETAQRDGGADPGAGFLP